MYKRTSRCLSKRALAKLLQPFNLNIVMAAIPRALSYSTNLQLQAFVYAEDIALFAPARKPVLFKPD